MCRRGNNHSHQSALRLAKMINAVITNKVTFLGPNPGVDLACLR